MREGEGCESFRSRNCYTKYISFPGEARAAVPRPRAPWPSRRAPYCCAASLSAARSGAAGGEGSLFRRFSMLRAVEEALWWCCWCWWCCRLWCRLCREAACCRLCRTAAECSCAFRRSSATLELRGSEAAAAAEAEAAAAAAAAAPREASEGEL